MLDIQFILKSSEGQNYKLHDSHINPQFGKFLNQIEFDNCYTKAKGSYLWDDKGNKYLDLVSGFGVSVLGRNNPVICRPLIDFINGEYPTLVKLAASITSGLLAKKLKESTPYGLDNVYFTNSGTESTEASIKLARHATSRSIILSANGAYHGATYGALSLLNGSWAKDNFGPLLPDCKSVPFSDLDALERALSTRDVAAFIVEPIQGNTINIPFKGYLKEAARLCRKYGTLFIADEILAGMGRTGHFLSLEHDGDVDPDMVILSKALSGGLIPIGAVMMKKTIYNKVFSSVDRCLILSSTFGQGDLAMVAGLATLDYVTQPNVLNHVKSMGDMIGNRLLSLKEQFEFIHDVRWRGLMLTVEFKTTGKFKHRSCLNVVKHLIQEHRILTRPMPPSLLKLFPAFVIDSSDVDYFITSFQKSMIHLNDNLDH